MFEDNMATLNQNQNRCSVISCRSITFSVFVCFCLSVTQWMKRVTSCPAGWFPPRGDVYLSKVSQFVARSTKSPSSKPNLCFYSFKETELVFLLLSSPFRPFVSAALCLKLWVCDWDWSSWDCRRVLQLRRQKVNWWWKSEPVRCFFCPCFRSDAAVWWWRVGCRRSIVAPFNI